ncbi:MAG TPA: hypothetical protein VLM42_10580 [Bryobacteraceae bacterium]|nr:hypothetical protein [Bryobacteraceae bacterium]
MMRSNIVTLVLTSLVAVAQQPASNGGAEPKNYPEDHRPPRFLRESWKDPLVNDGKQEPGVRQDHVESPNLELKLYGPPNLDIRIVRHATPLDDPSYIWSGSSPTNWALTLRDKSNYVDLSGPVAKIRWRIKMAGFHLLRPVLKLADGTFLVGDHAEGYTSDWIVTEFALADVRWRGLDIGRGVVETIDGQWKKDPDLSRVDEVGFTDLMRGSGGGPGGGTRVDWIEVYGNPLPRDAAKPR